MSLCAAPRRKVGISHKRIAASVRNPLLCFGVRSSHSFDGVGNSRNWHAREENLEGQRTMTFVKLIECPRDAWQGLPDFIPTKLKAAYLQELVLAGFTHIDAVSFVSPKHVKQMADSEEVMAQLDASLSVDIDRPDIIGIIVNEKGLERALATP